MNTILSLIEFGLCVEMGRHTQGLAGYYVIIYADVDECAECGQTKGVNTWQDAGHGLTLDEALTSAVNVYLGIEPPPRTEVFERVLS